MSWRFPAATAVLVVLVLGSTNALNAQDETAPDKGKPATKADGSAEKPAPAEQPAAGAATTSKAGTATAKSKATGGAKAKSKKSNVRSKSDASAGTTKQPPKYELATFGAGCFWHVEADFERLNGVVSAVSGYADGNVRNPNYEMVHEGITGHAEVVMVQYDPEIISYEELLKVFWTCHDPTTPNRQGPDVGPQYRSIILYHNEEQKKAALKSYEQLVEARAFRSPIVTQLHPLKTFYRAEDEHQDYYGGKPRASSSRRRTTSAAKSRKPQSKVARALTSKPAADGTDEQANKVDAPAGEPARTSETGNSKEADSKP